LITLDGYEEYSNKYLRATAEEIEMLQAQGVEMQIIDTDQLEENGAPKPKRKRIVFTPEPGNVFMKLFYIMLSKNTVCLLFRRARRAYGRRACEKSYGEVQILASVQTGGWLRFSASFLYLHVRFFY
jgi:hypothetical protein